MQSELSAYALAKNCFADSGDAYFVFCYGRPNAFFRTQDLLSVESKFSEFDNKVDYPATVRVFSERSLENQYLEPTIIDGIVQA